MQAVCRCRGRWLMWAGDKGKCRGVAPIGIRASRRQQAVTCKRCPAPALERGGDIIWVSALCGLGFSTQPQNTKPLRTNWKAPVSFSLKSSQNSYSPFSLEDWLVAHTMSPEEYHESWTPKTTSHLYEASICTLYPYARHGPFSSASCTKRYSSRSPSSVRSLKI